MDSFTNTPVDDVITLGGIGDSTELKVGVATFGVGAGIAVIVLGAAIITYT